MLSKPKDHEQMRAEMGTLIEALELPEMNKQFLRARWLEQVIWMDEKAWNSVLRHNVLRLTTIIGGVIVPALVSWNVGNGVGADLIKTLTVIVSLVVALSAAVEEFFHYGERWRHYRRTVEALKSEGWQFFQLSGPYANQTHVLAYPAFAARVEELGLEEVEGYMMQVAKEKREDQTPSTT
ncbi:MAG: DUF4231 domain-containing protein [Nitrospira sp.]